MTPERWLWAGLAAGLALAIFGALEPATEDPAAIDAVAIVDGVPITVARFEAALGAAPPGAARQAVLDDLIAEELLVAWALELDLPRLSPIPRTQLLREVTGLVTAEADRDPPIEAELRAFYDEHPEHFRGHRSYALEALWFRGADPARAAKARAAWIDGSRTLEELRAAADRPAAPLPEGLMPASSLRDHLGPSAARAVEGLQPGQVSEVLRVAGGQRVLRLVDVRVVDRPPFEAVRDAVASRLRSERRAARLRAAVAERRAGAAVVIDGHALDAGTGHLP